jgi:hypothetical protein
MMSKTIFEHFYNICHGKHEFEDSYNKDAMNNLLSNYKDTVDIASFLATKGKFLSSEKHYNICQLYVKKGKRYRPTYIKAKKDLD